MRKYLDEEVKTLSSRARGKWKQLLGYHLCQISWKFLQSFRRYSNMDHGSVNRPTNQLQWCFHHRWIYHSIALICPDLAPDLMCRRNTLYWLPKLGCYGKKCLHGQGFALQKPDRVTSTNHYITLQLSNLICHLWCTSLSLFSVINKIYTAGFEALPGSCKVGPVFHHALAQFLLF